MIWSCTGYFILQELLDNQLASTDSLYRNGNLFISRIYMSNQLVLPGEAILYGIKINSISNFILMFTLFIIKNNPLD